MDLTPLLIQIAAQYQLNPNGTHGLSHWGRVLENGLRIAHKEGGDISVITLFAIFHDACRVNQTIDPGHGKRGASLADELLSDNQLINQPQLELLKTACIKHTDGDIRGDLTVQICWDADRLDLARAGILPAPHRLCTETARKQDIRKWATNRARSKFTPDYVDFEWSPIFSALI